MHAIAYTHMDVMPKSQRLDRLLSHATGLARSEIKYILKARRVQVNEQWITQGKTPVSQNDRVQLDNQPVNEPALVYIMLNKPKGYVSTHHDEEHPSALSLIEGHFHPPLHFAGRLDVDTTGLLILTNDGQWSHRITSPRFEHNKTYLVTLAESLSASAKKNLEEGVWLNGEDKPTHPARVEMINAQQIRLTITEGRYHQVKRMLAAVDNKVQELHREQVAHIQLDATLSAGAYRQLSAKEIALD